MSLEIPPQTLQQWQRDKKSYEILDVREPHEFAYVNIGGKNVPLSTLPEHLENLDKNSCWVTLCHHGRRSFMAAQLLHTAGFKNVYSLEGGIDRWTREIDPHLPLY